MTRRDGDGVIVPLNPTHAIEYRQCPKCAYVLAQSVIAEMRFDPKCPRCLGARVSQFLPHLPIPPAA